MTIYKEGYIIETVNEYDDVYIQFETESKGYFYGITIKIDNGLTYQINFYDPVRLKQDVDSEFESNTIFFYEENVVIIPRINIDYMVAAIEELWKRHLFDKMIPFTPPNDLNV